MNIKSIAKALGFRKNPLSLFRRLCQNAILKQIPDKDLVLPWNDMKILVRNPRKSLIGRSIFLERVWEPDATKFISSWIKPDMSVLDIGADIGYYTLLFAKIVGPKGRVYSFEPIPKAKWYLDKNIKINKLNNVKTFSFALFDKSGHVCLEDPFIKSKINPSKKTLCKNDILVEMKVFDNWRLKQVIDNINLVKIDVEGAEVNTLRGMKTTLQNEHPAILIEVHPSQLESFGFTAFDLIEFIKSFAYKITPVNKKTIDFSQGNITLFCE